MRRRSVSKIKLMDSSRSKRWSRMRVQRVKRVMERRRGSVVSRGINNLKNFACRCLK